MARTLTLTQDAAMAAAEQLATDLSGMGAIALHTERGAVVIAPHHDLTIAIHHDDVWTIDGRAHRSFRVTVNACLALRHHDTTTVTAEGTVFSPTGTLRAVGALHFAACLT